MEWYIILLIIISSLIFFTFILSLCLHYHVCKKSYKTKENINKRATTFYGKEFKDEILKGMKELDNLPLEEVKINSFDNLELTGYFYKGSSEKVAIYVHGYHSSYRFDFSLGFKECYKRGYSLLFVDQRAHQKSEGKFTTMGVKERYDLQKWIEYIDRKFSGKAKILVWGVSMGAATVMYTLGLKLPKSVVGAICDCGYDIPIKAIEFNTKLIVKVGYRILTELINLGSIIRTGVSLKHLNTKDTLKENKLPIFLIHGTKDSVVPIEMGNKNYENANGLAIYAYVEGADHGLSYLVNYDIYEKCLLEFLKRTGIE